MKFTGEYLDPTGLYHLRARQHDPASGRFLTRDPLPAALGTHLTSAYAYVSNRSTFFVDPTGMIGLPPCWICDAAEAGAEAVGGAASSVGREVGQFVVEHRNEIVAGAAIVACVTTAVGCTVATYALLINTGANVALAGARGDWGCVAAEATAAVAAQGITTLGVKMVVSQRAAMSRTTRNRGKTFRYDMRLSGAQVDTLQQRGGGFVEGVASLADLCGNGAGAPSVHEIAGLSNGLGVNGK